MNCYSIPMDPSNFAILTRVDPPTVGADKSYWKVGFQTAPIYQTNRVSAGDPTGSMDLTQPFGYGGGGMLETLSACDSTVDNPINNAISAMTPIETAFTDHTGNNKLMVDASNGLRSERNEVCLRIWGLRQSIGNINDRITKLEGVRSFIDDTNVQKVVG